MKSFARALCSIVAIFAAPNLVSAQTIDQTDRGWYDDTGLHIEDNLNFIAGQTAIAELRNWFVFDISGVTDVITGATLMLEMPAAGFGGDNPTETYTLFDVSTPPEDLISGAGAIGAFNDLGSGEIHGEVVISGKDKGQFVNIPLNAAAIDALNAAGDTFSTGGAVTTLDGGFNEWVFGFSNDIQITKLVLETAPAECFLVIGNGPAQTSFATNLHSWTVQVGKVEDFHLVSLVDSPEFVLPVPRIGGPKVRRVGGDDPTPGKTTLRPTIQEPPNPAAGSSSNSPSPGWMHDRTFSVQVVMWNPGEFPDNPEQYSHPLLVRIRTDGRVVTIPYGSGTGMEVWAETGIDIDGNTVIRFPFTIPGL